MARHEMGNYWGELPDEPAGVALPDDGRQRKLFVDAGRVLMLWGWSALLAVVSDDPASKAPGAGDGAAAHAFLGLLLWLLGVSLLALEPTARLFPRAARFGAALSNAVVGGFLPRPWNELRGM